MDKPMEDTLNQLATQQKVQLIVSQEAHDDGEISLGELFGILLKGKTMIILITLIAFVIGAVGASVNSFVLEDTKGQVESIISFNFKGIEEGLNPAGESFNIAELSSKEVLENTVRQLGLGISSEKLREQLDIQGVIPAAAQAQMALINQMAQKDVTQLKQLEEIVYYPTQYKLTLHITKDMDLSGEEAEQVLGTIISNYTTYFMNKYGDKALLSTAITTMDPARYDYAEYTLLVDNTLKDMEAFIVTKEKEAPDYRAKSTGMSFGEIGKQVELLRNIELNNTQAIINTFMLTRDRDRIISIYENNLKNLRIELEEQQSIARSMRLAAADYQKDKLVVMGKENSLGNVEVSTSSKVYDQLIQEALDAEESAARIQYNMASYQEMLDRLGSDAQSYTAAQLAPYQKQVEESILSIQEQIGSLIELINNTVEEYYTNERFKSSVRRDMPAMYTSFTMNHLKSNALMVVIATLLGGVLSVLYVLMKGMMDTGKKDGKGGQYDEA